MTCRIDCSDAIAFMDSLPADSVDLVIGSPPYVDCRTYGIDAVYDCQAWIDWMLKVTQAAVRVSRGLVLWVAAGAQRDNNYWPACDGLMYEWWKRGGHAWRPVVWWKVDNDEGGTGIPGSGGNVVGRRWLRADWEYVMAFKKPGVIPYDHPELMGHEPVYSQVGGAMSNRTQDGQRINAGVGEPLTDARTKEWAADPWKTASRGGGGCGGRRKNGTKQNGKPRKKMDVTAGHDKDGNTSRADGRPMPKIANPGNVLPLIVKARVGGGHMGHTLCHENEAPYPEALPEFFVVCYSPLGGTVLDCFTGSGTTAAVSIRHGRNFIGCDLRQSQVDLAKRRISEETPLALFAD